MRWIYEKPHTFWKRLSDVRFQRLERLAHTKVGALYIRSGETEKQARRRILEAECHRLGFTYSQFKQLLDLKRKRPVRERKRKPTQEQVSERVTTSK